MRKSLILVLTAIGGSASYATAITAVGKEPGVSDPATWRWHVEFNSRRSDEAIRGTLPRPPEIRTLALLTSATSVIRLWDCPSRVGTTRLNRRLSGPVFAFRRVERVDIMRPGP